ncbi:MAG: STAS domain-containing protein [Gammaproteobacteria bacterium]|nr:MAG: STAS domain-containing protein [Gammaproteobacteria bacterium]
MKTGTDEASAAAPVPVGVAQGGASYGTRDAKPAIEAEAAPAKPPRTPPATNEVVELRLDGGEALDLAHAAGLHAEFRLALAQKKPLRLNLSQVQLVDTAGVQLLLALRRAAEKNGITATWEAPTRELCAVASQLGLGEMLELPSPEGVR